MAGLSLARWASWMLLPRSRQRQGVEAWLAELPAETPGEAWNVAFGPGSLFDAWTRTTVVQGLYAANAELLRGLLAERPGARVLEVGGGDGRLWRAVGAAPAELVVVDPAAEVGERVRAACPGARITHVAEPVEHTLDDVDLWRDLDAVVISLTLHHVAGADARERARHGLDGPGKLEILQRVREALAPDGRVLVNEADIHCDLEIPAGPLLAERLLDSYVRRCAGSVLHDIEHRRDADDDLRARWRSIVRHWCLEQVRYADVPVVDRDVYELDVPRWLALFERAGLGVVEHGFTDDVLLFHRYVLGRGSASCSSPPDAARHDGGHSGSPAGSGFPD